ncbi:MFS transporter [Paenibacillus thermoaerophilus]|uniref:MFS transporter n=1 Tax=Paenibacillus thermoaerophilus TaxID=1215385 RepID=A0ABW2V0A6_9BACL|nr:MFS transporter [Paenibacillus thermoaerophilus]TMV15877.1 MFS transporter [Paenibacillus thermoaerophilus]
MWPRRAALPPEKRLSAEAVTSLIVHFFFILGSNMAGLFLNLYLWRLTESLWVNGLYNIIAYSLTPFAFALGGWVSKKMDRVIALRIGVALTALFYLLVIIVRESVVDWYPLFAVFAALASSFYWSAYLTIMYDVSTEQNRIRYMGFNMIAFTAAGLVGPMLAGWIIAWNEGLRGYIIVFSFAFVMYLLTTVASLRIRAVQTHHHAYYLKFAGLLLRKQKLWRGSLMAFLTLGTLQGIMLFLPNILLYKALPDEQWIGYVGAICSLVSIGVSLGMTRAARERHARLYLVIGAAGFSAAALLLTLGVDLFTVVMFMLLHALINPLYSNTLNSYYYRLVAQLPLKGQLAIEAVVIRETFLNIGRVVSIFALVAIADGPDSVWLPWVIVAASLAQFTMAIWIDRNGGISGQPDDAGHSAT